MGADSVSVICPDLYDFPKLFYVRMDFTESLLDALNVLIDALLRCHGLRGSGNHLEAGMGCAHDADPA